MEIYCFIFAGFAEIWSVVTFGAGN